MGATNFLSNNNDVNALTIQLTERQRAAAVRLSSTPVGGDGHGSPIILLALPGAFTDVALNPNLPTGLVGVETYDTTPPVLAAVRIDYATGLVVFTFDETIDAVVGGLTRMAQPTLLDAVYAVDDPDGGTSQGQSGHLLHLSGAVMVPSSQENTSITVQLQEHQRVAFHGISATRDSTPVRFGLDPRAFRDVSNNTNAPSTAGVAGTVQATEIVDGTFPSILSASLNFSNGVMVLTSTETLDVDNDPYGLSGTKLNLAHVRLVNQTGDVPDMDHRWVQPPGGVTLDGGTVVPLDGTSITLHLLEAKRVVALRISGMPGGDNSGTVLDVLAGAFRDIAGNAVTSSLNVPVVEYPDIVSPVVTTASLHLGTGLLSLSFGETVDGQVTAIDLARGWMYFNRTDGVEPVMLLNVTTPLTERNTTLLFQIDEPNRVHLVQLMQLPPLVGAKLSLPSSFAVDLAGNPSEYAPRITVVPTLDVIPPFVVSISLNYSNGHLHITTSEEMDLTLPEVVQLDKILLRNTPSGTTLLARLGEGTTYEQVEDTNVIQCVLSEELRGKKRVRRRVCRKECGGGCWWRRWRSWRSW